MYGKRKLQCTKTMKNRCKYVYFFYFKGSDNCSGLFVTKKMIISLPFLHTFIKYCHGWARSLNSVNYPICCIHHFVFAEKYEYNLVQYWLIVAENINGAMSTQVQFYFEIALYIYEKMKLTVIHIFATQTTKKK